jgi:hypothetical protein|tara:strand:- start:19887 stop:27974 length:8088 start_codon:yes stop_codon:yes gene_type:complete
MPQKTNLNVSPYYEDFDANKNFYKILFRPGYSIQGRELTQVQSILQNQVESFGKYAFKQGELVIPGEVGLNTKLDYVKLSSVSEVAVSEGDDIVYKKYDISQLIGQQLIGLTSGVKATILATTLATESSADTLYVNYINSGSSNTEPTFRQGETLEVVDGVNTPLLVVGTDGSVLPTSIQVTNPDTEETTSLESPAMGYGSAVKVEEGIYFVNGYFVRCNQELLVIDEYYNKPSAKIGFTIKEEIVTPEEDASLYDNAIGSSNYTAPGAHRLKISLQLKEFALNAITDKNFIQLLTVSRGQVQSKVSSTDFSVLEQTLARRTFDESGNYVVDNFSVDIREWAQKDKNKGFYAVDEFGLYNGYDAGTSARKMIASVGPGKAYIKGYEIVNKETKYLEINKARESLSSDNVTLKSRGLPSYCITNVYGSVPLNKEGSELTAYPDVFLYSSFNDGSIGLNNTELTTDHRQTIDRRGKFFSANDGIKTITLQITSPTTLIGSVTDSTFQTQFGELFYIKTRSDVGTPTAIGSFKTLSFATTNKPLINASESVQFLELTVFGPKNELEQLLLEYDLSDTEQKRNIYLTEGDAASGGAEFGFIVDYSNTITPIIGKVKPNNFFLKERGSGFNSDSDIVLSKGRLAAGTNAYNTTFGISYFDPQFFTKIIIETTPAGYDEGKYVFGVDSGAYGVVEGTPSGVYTTGTILFVTTLSGRFLPGETIRDEDGNTVRIAKENTISHFVVQNRGLGYADGVTLLINGLEYDNSKIELLKSVDGKIYKAAISNRSAVGVEYAQPPAVTAKNPDASGAPNSAAAIVPVLYRDTVTTYTPQNVKSLGCSYGSGNANSFSADVVINSQKYSQIKTVTNYTFFGTQGSTFVESTSFSADASTDVQQGDLIQFSDDDNNLVRAIVQFATQQEGAYKSRIYLDTALPGSVTNASIVRLRPKVDNSTSGTLLFSTGSKQISQVSAGGDDTKIKYFFRRDFVTTASSGGGVITFAAQLPFGTQRFAAFSEENLIITVIDPGDAPDIVKGDIIFLEEDDVEITSSTDTSSGLTSGSISLQLPTTYFGTIPANGTFPKLKLTATLEVSNAKPRLKTVVRNKRITVTSAGDRVVPLRGTDYDTEVVEILSYSDAFKLRYVYEGTSSQPPQIDTAGNLISGTDVTSRYTFDDGQRDTIYDVSRIVLKPGFEETTGQLVIAFDYFEHSQGDFCTIDSYLHDAGVAEDEVPSFNSSVLGITELKNVIDFRPKVDTTAIIPGFLDTAILERTQGSFAGSGAIIASSPAPDINLEFTFSFSQKQYLDRIDGIFLDQNGNFIIKEGNSSLNPSKPDPIEDAVPLFYAHIPAFTKTSKDVRITPVDNRRYTMRDIGKLEKRIERLEYYTTLSILEQQALNMQVKDEIGLDRFKSGFFVDNFEAHRVGNLSSLDYRCAVDSQQSVLRPQAKEDSINLVEVNTREDQRTVSGYKKIGNMVTLPYSPLSLLGNSFASGKLNPNPFVVLQYVGDSDLSPAIDQWYDQTEEPVVVDTNTDLFNIFLAKENVKESFSSLFNSFVVNWVGASSTFTSINSLGGVNSQIASTSVTSASVGSSSNISPQNNEVGKGVQTKIVGDNIVSTSLAFYTRSLPVKFKIGRMKPNTKIYVFLEGRDISRWVNPDLRYTGIAGNSLSAFNGTITTDEYGNASGLIIIPAGNPPTQNATWSGDVDTVSYDEDAEELNFTTGELTFRFTSSATNESKLGVDSYTEIKYYATGILPENPSSIVSTKPSIFKSNEGVQFIESNTDNPIRPNPLAQTFKIENLDGGCFVTGLDLYFSKKSTNIPVKTYITNVDAEKPAKNIIPGSEKTLSPNTFIKCFASGNMSVTQGENVTGASSAASGPILKIFDKNNVELVATASGKYSLTNEQVYTVVLSNHNGKSFRPNEDLTIPSVTLANATNATDFVLAIAKDSGKLSDIRVTNTGLNYDSAILTIESPQLPGGSTATARIEVSGGKIYNTEISLSGFGYTEAPSVVIKGVGNGAGGCEIQTFIEIDTPAVRMGVATDQTGVTQSTTPTHFAFDYPVYLQNNTEYALIVETDSIDYELWSSKLGDTDIATSTVITTQPSLGSVYRSQNTESWTEDIFEDLKFTMYRAQFDTTRPAELLVKNKGLGYELLDQNPFETNASANTNSSSKLFKNNNSIVKVNHRDHSFEDTGGSYVFYRTALETGGITSSVLNSTLFQVSNSGIDSYNIISSSQAAGNSIGGGSAVYASTNRKYETLYPQVSYLSFTGTTLSTEVKTTDVVPVDSTTTNYTSYSQPDYEKTFLNEPHYFTNQKFIASNINETLNNLSRSLTYKMTLSSTVSHLSPIIDLSSATVKTVSNRIENATGQEDRFGRRDQVIEFYPVYQFNLAGNGGTDLQDNQTIKGSTTKAVGTIARVVGQVVYVRVKTSQFFQKGETVTLGNQLGLSAVTVDSNPTQVLTTIADAATIVARNPSVMLETYDNIITGKATIWNSQTQKLTLRVDANPINNNFTDRIIDSALYNRNAVVADQIADIFRVGDFVKYPNQPDEEKSYLEVGKVMYTNGLDFVGEDTSKNGSAVAKYITKEVSITSPATAIDVHLLANVKDISNLEVFYKFKKASSQENFDDIDWIYFNKKGEPDTYEIATSENTISGIVEKQSAYQDLKYTASNLPEYSSFAIKIVMKGVDPAYVPKIQDIRAVAAF